MTHVDTAQTESKKAEPRKVGSPREMLRRIVEANPEDTRAEVFEEFRRKLNRRESYIETIIENWFMQAFASITAKPTKDDPAARAAMVAARKARLRAGLGKAVETRVKIILLDMQMPNGKPLRHCTGRECRYFARTIGSWLRRVSRSIKPKDIVGNVMTEKQLVAIYEA